MIRKIWLVKFLIIISFVWIWIILNFSITEHLRVRKILVEEKKNLYNLELENEKLLEDLRKRSENSINEIKNIEEQEKYAQIPGILLH
jgi:hypothetical protein